MCAVVFVFSVMNIDVLTLWGFWRNSLLVLACRKVAGMETCDCLCKKWSQLWRRITEFICECVSVSQGKRHCSADRQNEILKRCGGLRMNRETFITGSNGRTCIIYSRINGACALFLASFSRYWTQIASDSRSVSQRSEADAETCLMSGCLYVLRLGTCICMSRLVRASIKSPFSLWSNSMNSSAHCVSCPFISLWTSVSRSEAPPPYCETPTQPP